MKWCLSLAEIVQLLGTSDLVGAFKGEVTGIADLRKAGPNDLSFLSSAKFARHLPESKACVVLVPEKQAGSPAEGQAWIRCADPSLALGKVCAHLEERIRPRPEPGIHPTAVVDPGAQVDPSATVGPWCIVKEGAVIGKGAILESNVRIEREAVVGEGSWLHHGVVIGWSCQVGRHCILFPGAVIGADGFGYHSDQSGHHRLAQIGKVVLEDHVEIGANSSVDRARFSETRIGEGTKLDNLVQVGHNVIVGKHCILCSGVGVSGSVEIGNFVILAGQVGVSGHLKIGDKATATGQTGITKDVPPGAVLGGTPARPHRELLRQQVLAARLPEILDRLKALEEGGS